METDKMQYYTVHSQDMGFHYFFRSYCAQCVYMDVNIVDNLEQKIAIRFSILSILQNKNICCDMIAKWPQMNLIHSLMKRQRLTVIKNMCGNTHIDKICLINRHIQHPEGFCWWCGGFFLIFLQIRIFLFHGNIHI